MTPTVRDSIFDPRLKEVALMHQPGYVWDDESPLTSSVFGALTNYANEHLLSVRHYFVWTPGITKLVEWKNQFHEMRRSRDFQRSMV